MLIFCISHQKWIWLCYKIKYNQNLYRKSWQGDDNAVQCLCKQVIRISLSEASLPFCRASFPNQIQITAICEAYCCAVPQVAFCVLSHRSQMQKRLLQIRCEWNKKQKIHERAFVLKRKTIRWKTQLFVIRMKEIGTIWESSFSFCYPCFCFSTSFPAAEARTMTSITTNTLPP